MNDFLDHVGEYQRELPRAILSRCREYRYRCLDLHIAHGGHNTVTGIRLMLMAENFDEICMDLGYPGYLENALFKFNRVVEALNTILLEEAVYHHFEGPTEKDDVVHGFQDAVFKTLINR